jgi:hypothetical protein
MENSPENHHQPSEDSEPMQKTWRRIRPYWHIATTFMVAIGTGGVAIIVWVTAVNALPGRVDDLDKRVAVVESKVGKIDLINQRVNDIADFMGAPKYKRNHDVENH